MKLSRLQRKFKMALSPDLQAICKKVAQEKIATELKLQEPHKNGQVRLENKESLVDQDHLNKLQIHLKKKKTADMSVNLTIRLQECIKIISLITCLVLQPQNKLLEHKVLNNLRPITIAQQEVLLVLEKAQEVIKIPI